jgi:hypothetical protein
MAPRDIVPGTAYPAAISGAIAHAKVMVLVSSSAANMSRHVEREVAAADDGGLPVIPLRVEAIAPSPTLQYYIRLSHWLDAPRPTAAADLDRLTAAVRAHAQDSPPEPPKPPDYPPDVPVSALKARQLEFWTAVRARLLADKVVASAQAPLADHYFNLGLGRGGTSLSCVLNTADRRLDLRLYLQHRIAGAALAQLGAQRAQIEAEFGEPLAWNPSPENRNKVIVLPREVDLARRQWPAYVAWLVGRVGRFLNVFGPRIRALVLKEPTDPAGPAGGGPTRPA